jgi:hypothetical protein
VISWKQEILLQVKPMSDFDDRLKNALHRGQQRSEDKKQAEAAKQATEDELKNLHSKYRLTISDHIERVVARLADHLPGFRYESVFGANGWGAAAWSDELRLKGGSKTSRYSRLEITVKPVTGYFILELRCRGTISNREALSRSYFEPVAEVNIDQFKQLIDTWTLQFAEYYAANKE